MAALSRPLITTPAVRVVHLALGLLGFVTVGWNLRNTLQDPDASIVNFFSFFTIESNLFAAAIWVWVAAKPRPTVLQDRLRGAATLYMAITGIIYAVLLSGGKSDTQAWINDVEHRVLPVAIALDWMIVVPHRKVRPTTALPWLLVPLAFFAYSLIRGAFVDWYPYPFMSPEVHPYGTVFITAGVLAVLMGLLAMAIAWLGSLRTPDDGPAAPARV